MFLDELGPNIRAFFEQAKTSGNDDIAKEIEHFAKQSKGGYFEIWL